jgi:hypothetical protein
MIAGVLADWDAALAREDRGPASGPPEGEVTTPSDPGD